MRLSSINTALAAFSLIQGGAAISMNLDNVESISAASSVAAHGLMNYYKGNQTGRAADMIGVFDKPIYWWEAGAIWGGLIDHWAYTGDDSYNGVVQQAMAAQAGPNADFINAAKRGETGNDDQAFWALSAMSAVEYGFPDPPAGAPSYIDLAKNTFDSIIARWDTTSCGGGFKWQIYPENTYGWNYKNTVSQSSLMQLAARLAMYTGEQKYTDWANKVWDWSTQAGFISPSYEVWDGADDRTNCKVMNQLQWSYNVALYLHAAAAMRAVTGDDKWLERTQGLVGASKLFFKDGVMYEQACEEVGTCNQDQLSFKAYLARWMAKSAVLVPEITNDVMPLLKKSAEAAAQSCVGGSDGATCGTKWFVDGWDGKFGVGQQLSALETMQSLLISRAPAIKSLRPGTPALKPKIEPEPSSSAAAPVAPAPKPMSSSVSKVATSPTRLAANTPSMTPHTTQPIATRSSARASVLASASASRSAPLQVTTNAAPTAVRGEGIAMLAALGAVGLMI